MPNAPVDHPTDANARAEAYAALANVFRPPAEAADRSPTVSLDDLSRVYNRLFVGPLPPLAHPYESVYRTPDARLMGDVTRQVIEAYAGAGLALPDGSRDMPDHVTVELEFMAYLAAGEAAARVEGDLALAATHLQRQAVFLRDHLTPWIPYFCHRVIEANRDGYYGQAATVLAGFVVRDLQVVAAEWRAVSGRPSPSAASDQPSAAGQWNVVFHPEQSAMSPCTLCGICAEVCRPAALRLNNDGQELTLLFDPALCVGCPHCVKYCPERILLVEPAAGAPPAAEARAVRQLAASAIARCVRCDGPLGEPLPISEIAVYQILKRFRQAGGSRTDEPSMYLCHACKLGVMAAH